ncbi:hypothetical protein AB1Y20_018346 [Prymnesium parvum]|uniref:Ras GTPase-activating protein n=1 Tax=Prymnesium parvum TaxID=97485 RepID=A0AB34JPB9_PRYPA
MPAVSAKSSKHLIVLPNKSDIVREGWLHKRGGSHGGRTNWKRRWFSLAGTQLYYMETRHDATPRGRISLSGCDFRKADEEVKKPYSFGIYSRSEYLEAPFFCHADSALEAEEWLDALRGAAVGRYDVAEGTPPHTLLAQIAAVVREHEPPRQMAQAELQLSVVEARGLAPMDFSGTSDPYCVVQCGVVKARTRTIGRTVNPKWNETFRWQVAPQAELQVDVYDRNVLSSDYFLGTVLLKVDDFLIVSEAGRVHDRWCALQPRTAKDDHVQGEIRLCVVARLAEDAESSRAADGEQPPASVVQQVSAALGGLKLQYENSQLRAQRLARENSLLRAGLRDLFSLSEFSSLKAQASRSCILHLKVLEARGVHFQNRKGGLCDVYCVVQLGLNSHKTELRRSTNSPRWELLLELPIVSWNEYLEVQLFDASNYNPMARAELVGKLSLQLLALGCDTPNDQHDAWHLLSLEKGRNSRSAENVRPAAASGGAGLADAQPSLRVVCDWRYAGGAADADESSAEAKARARSVSACSEDVISKEFEEATRIRDAITSRMSAQEQQLERIHALLGSLKDEFVGDYHKYCAHKLGVLSVTVAAAFDLPIKDKLAGTTDPFVELCYAGQSHATMPQKKGIAPRWDETFEFDVYPDNEPDDEIVVSLRHQMQWGRSKYIGEVRIPVRPLFDQQPRSRMLPIAVERRREPFGENERRGSAGSKESPRAQGPRLSVHLRFKQTQLEGQPAAKLSAQRIEALGQLQALLCSEDAWLPLALCEAVPIEHADRLAKGLVNTQERPTLTLLKLFKLVIQKELDETSSEKLVFRRNSIATKLATFYAKRYGRDMINSILQEPICAIIEASERHGLTDCSLEVDPQRLPSGLSDEEREARLHVQQSALAETVRLVLGAMVDVKVPQPISILCWLIWQSVERRFGKSSTKEPPAGGEAAATPAHAAVSGVLFLRFIVPALAAPAAHGVLQAPPSAAAARGFMLVSKAVMTIGNGVLFGSKEPFMTFLNPIISDYVVAVRGMIRRLSELEPDEQVQNVLANRNRGRSTYHRKDNGEADAATLEANAPQLGALQDVHFVLSSHADVVYNVVAEPGFNQTLHQLLTDLGPPDHGVGASTVSDWTPETIVARVVAVRDAMLKELRRHDGDGIERQASRGKHDVTQTSAVEAEGAEWSDERKKKRLSRLLPSKSLSRIFNSPSHPSAAPLAKSAGHLEATPELRPKAQLGRRGSSSIETYVMLTRRNEPTHRPGGCAEHPPAGEAAAAPLASPPPPPREGSAVDADAATAELRQKLHAVQQASAPSVPRGSSFLLHLPLVWVRLQENLHLRQLADEAVRKQQIAESALKRATYDAI